MPTNYKHTDFDIDFNKNSFTNDFSLRHDSNSVRQSIMNIVLTRKGEKPFNREFGVGMHDYLFESLSPTDFAILEMDISEEVSSREPRATIESVEINDAQTEIQSDNNNLIVNINYFVNKGTQATPELESLRIEIAKVR